MVRLTIVVTAVLAATCSAFAPSLGKLPTFWQSEFSRGTWRIRRSSAPSAIDDDDDNDVMENWS